jgi:uncharacterized protein
MAKSWMKCAFPRLAVAWALLCGLSAFAIDVDKLPKPTGYVSDLAHVVDDASKQQLEEFSAAVEQQLGVQLAFATIDTLDDRPIRDVALEISRKWGVGDRKTNQGVFLLLAVKDRKSDIETGRGIEPYLTDGFSGGTLRSMRPDLRSGNYGAALLTAAGEMARQIAQGKNLPFTGNLPARTPERGERSRGSGIPFPLIIFGIFLLLWLFGRGARRGGGRYGGGGGGAGDILTGMVIGNMLGGRRGGGGSDWGSGGGFGGDSGGGGGFGGFGGGDFGGGGASSDW